VKWPGDIAAAKAVQELLCKKVRIASFHGRPRFVAGVDAAFSLTRVFAAACLYHLPDLIFVEQATAVQDLRFPYVPGLLSFREGPAVIEVLGRLTQRPDVILVDGQGIAHPRGIGLASHIGVMLDIPAVGCAKQRLVGDHQEPGMKKGEWELLRYHDVVVGAVLRTRDNVRPLYISPGHCVNVNTAIGIVLSCLGRYRIPEPLRCADMLSKKIKRDIAGSGSNS
jgi:deoxyribonuclease V